MKKSKKIKKKLTRRDLENMTAKERGKEMGLAMSFEPSPTWLKCYLRKP